MKADIDVAVEEAGKWVDMEGVILVGQGKKGDEDCILVLTSVDPEEMSDKIPATFRGYQVVIEFSDEVRAL